MKSHNALSANIPSINLLTDYPVQGHGAIRGSRGHTPNGMPAHMCPYRANIHNHNLETPLYLSACIGVIQGEHPKSR